MPREIGNIGDNRRSNMTRMACNAYKIQSCLVVSHTSVNHAASITTSTNKIAMCHAWNKCSQVLTSVVSYNVAGR